MLFSARQTGVAPPLFTLSTAPSVSFAASFRAEIARVAPAYQRLIACCVDLDHTATNTIANTILMLGISPRGIAIADIDLDNANKTADELRSRGTKTEVFLCDVTDPASAEAAARAAITAFGQVDILVNVAER